MKNFNKYAAEFVGTFALALVVSLSISGTFPISTPVLAALTLGLFVYTLGHISGTHINPAITAGALSIGKISFQNAVAYWVAQFLGAGLAMVVADQMSSSVTLTVSASPWIAIAEGLGAFFFAFGVASAIYGRTPKDVLGVVVGGSLLMGISIAASVSNGVLNPAVALAIGSFNLMYVLGPVVGAVLGMWAYKLISERK